MSTERPQLEGEVYYPDINTVTNAHVPDWEAMADFAKNDLQGFWAQRAEELEWFERWTTVLDDSNKPFYKWFVGGKTNIVHNCIDRHL